MWLKKLSVLNFKNYTEATLQFTREVNAFTGANGAGKTNLLDAIHYLSLCKSYFNPVDSQQIKQGEDWFMVQGEFDKDGQLDLVACSLKRNQKKQFKKNKKEYTRLADHIGQFPLVMISPNDSAIVTEGSEERRRFVDNVISQTDLPYLDRLIAYNRCLMQRNSLLKQASRGGVLDKGLLDVLDAQLVELGLPIFEKRRAFMDEFIPEFNRHYGFLTETAESVSLTYESQLMGGNFAELLKQHLDRDRALERTTVGIHKDDLQFTIHVDMPLKKFGSQGQQKSFLIALKLAQYSFLYRQKGFKPLLLLDDIFDKLDDHRTRKLMQMVSADDFGQIFLTDTDAVRINRIFEEINRKVRVYEISHGTVQ
ncbi:DNA replication and repair protein RecF [Parapedobacter defluvii]|uniref:DNA replication and repair protein RecF n=1 Tax=Parapedobacter defluvii TaxID=2045106 RepID=A0ABQ1L5N5_9SPHI|nr:DNA replication and repair protein RecF [Parapedobacter defluvii]RQP11990.1 MAG: DNA replication and repair protein RecF [Parapedobacter sp.]GGC19764.1 DNA replication and repair protein RecF [Parapedobacter defluvii]